jgi:hypothetical protein
LYKNIRGPPRKIIHPYYKTNWKQKKIKKKSIYYATNTKKKIMKRKLFKCQSKQVKKNLNDKSFKKKSTYKIFKLADFGISIFYEEEQPTQFGDSRYLAPEIFDYKLSNSKVLTGFKNI